MSLQCFISASCDGFSSRLLTNILYFFSNNFGLDVGSSFNSKKKSEKIVRMYIFSKSSIKPKPSYQIQATMIYIILHSFGFVLLESIYVPSTVLSMFWIRFQLCSIEFVLAVLWLLVPSIFPLCSIHGSINILSPFPARFCQRRLGSNYPLSMFCLRLKNSGVYEFVVYKPCSVSWTH